MRSGLTLVELLVSLAITVILVFSLTIAHNAGVRFQERTLGAVSRFQLIHRFENDLQSRFRTAYLTADATDQQSYFVASASGGDLATVDTVTFTTLGDPIPGAAVASQDELPDRIAKLGPQGGPSEIAFSTAVIGEGTEGGLLLRVQKPSDGDPTQGGRQSTFAAEVAPVSWEFWDGTVWQTQWDTLAQSRRLPAAVRLTYRWGQEDFDRVVTCPLQNSDVTPENPVLQEGGA